MKGLTLSDLQRMGADIVSVGPSVVVPEEPKARGRTERTSGMNKTEARYALHLEGMKQAGEIAGYWYEPLKFRLADKTYYNIDFLVMLPCGLLECHEVKTTWSNEKPGWREDARVKWKVAAEQFWMFEFLAVTKTKSGWEVERYNKQTRTGAGNA